jgi:hypothetical protein
MRAVLAAVIGLSIADAVAAQSVLSKDVSVTVSGKSAHLTFREFSGLPVDLKPFSGAAIIMTADLLFATKKGEISYVVLKLGGPTNERSGSGYCGAGYEENLVWIKSSHTAVLDVRSVRYSSCAFSIEPIREVTPTPNGLTIEYESFSEGRKYVCTYDVATPENGLSVMSSKLSR